MDKPCGVQRNWKLSLTLGCTSSVTNKASRLHALLFFFLFTLASLVLSQSRTRWVMFSPTDLWSGTMHTWSSEIQSVGVGYENCQVFVTTFSDVARCCACFANPFTTSSNTIQQCCKTFRWNVACVWPGLYNAAKLLLKNRWFTQTSLIQRKVG